MLLINVKLQVYTICVKKETELTLSKRTFITSSSICNLSLRSLHKSIAELTENKMNISNLKKNTFFEQINQWKWKKIIKTNLKHLFQIQHKMILQQASFQYDVSFSSSSSRSNWSNSPSEQVCSYARGEEVFRFVNNWVNREVIGAVSM
jgi:hypothetical protein